jgi:protein-S-isoprenylcysteine O-methyltransferase Ste14
MTTTIDLNKSASELGGLVIEAKTPESDNDKIARIKMANWTFWMGHFWKLLVVICLGAVMIIVFGYVKDPDVATAQWARALVMSLISAGIAFVAGRLTR